jgi:hypothetical protein
MSRPPTSAWRGFWLLAMVSASVLVIGRPGLARAQDAEEAIRLDYQSGPGCPDEASFVARIRARTQRAHLVAEGESAREFDVRIVASGRPAGTVTVVNHGHAEGARSVNAGTCEEVADALSLIVALALDPRAMAPATPLTPSSVPVAGPDDSSESDVERLLLRAGREPASSNARQRALLAATGVMTASTLTTTGTAATTAVGKAAIGAKAASLASFKWIAIAGLTSLGAMAGAVAVHVAREAASANVTPPLSERSEQPPSRSVNASSGTGSEPRLADSAPSSVPLAPPTVESAPTAHLPLVDEAPVGVAPVAVVHPTSSVGAPHSAAGSGAADEVATLDQARTVLGHGDPARALSILDEYARRFPRGALAPEAAVLRIEALVAAGDRAAATRAAQSFLRANPSSPYAQRIESLLLAPNP